VSLPTDSLGARLEVLYRDLAEVPQEAACSPQVARVFNALLAESRTRLADDPIVKSMGSLRPDQGEERSGFPSMATVRILVGQLRTAVDELVAASDAER
jgi:hypothetical protein